MTVKVIAEVGQTHAGDVDRALFAVDAFASAGAWAVKFQIVNPETIATEWATPYWKDATTETQREQFARVEPWSYGEWHDVARRCVERDVEFIATPFDLDAVGILDDLRTDGLTSWVKIASGDLTHVRLLREVAGLGFDVILSTGASDEHEVVDAVRLLRQHGARRLIVLACSLVYPCALSDAMLGRVAFLRRQAWLEGCEVGYSDHTPDVVTGAIAVAFGASVLEKHVTVTPDDVSIGDNAFALVPHAFMDYVDRARDAEGSGDGSAGLFAVDAEYDALHGARRAAYWRVDGRPGETRVEDAIEYLRPHHPNSVPIDVLERWIDLGVVLARPVQKGAVVRSVDLDLRSLRD